MTKEKIVDRVQKLLALAGNNPNEAERDAAMAKVQAMLIEHGMEMADIEKASEVGDIDQERVVFWGGPWARHVADSIAELYFCSYAYAKGPSFKDCHIFVGKTEHRRVAISIARWVVEAIGKEAYRGKKEFGAKYVTSFCKGAATAVCQKIEQLKAAAEAGEIQGSTGKNLPAVIYDDQATKWLDDNLDHEPTKQREREVSDVEGYYSGKDFGNGLNLGPQVEGGKGQELLS